MNYNEPCTKASRIWYGKSHMDKPEGGGVGEGWDGLLNALALSRTSDRQNSLQTVLSTKVERVFGIAHRVVADRDVDVSDRLAVPVFSWVGKEND